MKTLALAVFLCSSPLASAPARAETPASQTAAAAAVQSGLVAPLAEKEGRFSRFSRARRPPVAHRVRLLDEAPLRDAKGDAFVRFALDSSIGYARPGAEPKWQQATETGCVYAASGKVFVQRGERHFPAGLVLGEKVAEAAGACEAAAPRG